MDELVENTLKAPVDPYGRIVTDLRVSLTTRCNLQCPYCHKEGTDGDEEEREAEFWGEVFRTAVMLGINRALKITGGEPLLRTDLEEIVSSAKEAGFQEVSLVTNGFLLDGRRARTLARAGLSRINIGCDAVSSSILPKTYERVGDAVESALAAGLVPVKLNMVVLAGINDRQIPFMMEIARREGVVLQLIELVKSDADFYRNHHTGLEELEKDMERKAVRTASRLLQGRRVFWLKNGAVVELVRPTHANFCKNCRKIRVTPSGRIKPCLFSRRTVPFTGLESFMTAMSLRRPFDGDG